MGVRGASGPGRAGEDAASAAQSSAESSPHTKNMDGLSALAWVFIRATLGSAMSLGVASL